LVEHDDKLVYTSILVGKFPNLEIGPQVGISPAV